MTGEAPLSALMPGTQDLAHSDGQMKMGQGTQNGAPTSFPKAQRSWVHSCFSRSQGLKTEEQRIQQSLLNCCPSGKVSEQEEGAIPDMVKALQTQETALVEGQTTCSRLHSHAHQEADILTPASQQRKLPAYLSLWAVCGPVR